VPRLADARLQRLVAEFPAVLVTGPRAAGKTTTALDATLHVGGRSVHTRKGAACVGPHRGLVKATLAGAIRSNALA